MTLPTRTLKDYRPQHDSDCASNRCRCGERHKGKRCLTSGNPEFHDFDAPPCSCGLDHLLAEFDAPGAQERKEENKDHGAGLIHQAIPDMAGTEPRLNKSEK